LAEHHEREQEWADVIGALNRLAIRVALGQWREGCSAFQPLSSLSKHTHSGQADAARDTLMHHPLNQLCGDSSYQHIIMHHQVTLLNMSMCAVAPEAFVFPAALAIADDPLNISDRAEKMN